MNRLYQPLTGTAVRLVPMERAHASALYETARAPGVWTYIPVRMESPEDMQRLVDEAMAEAERGHTLPYTIMDSADSRVLGSTRLFDLSDENHSLELGWTWLTPGVWRTRVNTECKLLLLTHAFETMGANRVQIKTDSRNERSRRAIERIGAVFEGALRCHYILPDGYVRDSVYYSVVSAEWPEVKHRMEHLLTSPPSSRRQVRLVGD
ncbi:GNAT family N-acetyltransferase [Paenibacillus oceani]|uniref:GNAT family N-acetyltransferase n=1 Tax=Paenibacillus oceani TaxID=2772510 RepID=A0A927H1I1_9BACL|nr:GNAT family protein [Paenibacillus oceani]MBD2864212.1 GNAT family N-acetyltransferase [Paenibacillus oceani]